MTGFINRMRDLFARKKPIETNKPRLSLWEKFPNREDYKNELVRLLIQRAEKNMESGEIDKAINRYEGFFKQHPENQDIHNRVAELYLKTGNKLKAGRHLYFKEHLSEEEKECVNVFEAWCGNSVRTVKYLMSKDNFRFTKLDNYTQKKFRLLVLAACEEVGTTPKFLQAYTRHFVKSDKINHKNSK